MELERGLKVGGVQCWKIERLRWKIVNHIINQMMALFTVQVGCSYRVNSLLKLRASFENPAQLRSLLGGGAESLHNLLKNMLEALGSWS